MNAEIDKTSVTRTVSQNEVQGGEKIARRMKTTFDARIKQIGSSHYILIKKDTMESMQLREGDDIDVTIAIPTTSMDRGDDE